MSFIAEDDIYRITEGLIAHLFGTCLNAELQIPFPKLSYADAMEMYGRDNPDIRFALELKDLTDIVRNSALKVFQEVASTGGVIKAIKIEDGESYTGKTSMVLLTM